MNCIKTGARVLLTSHNWVVPADLFKVGDCIVINYNANCPLHMYAPEEATHILVDSITETRLGNVIVTEIKNVQAHAAMHRDYRYEDGTHDDD